MQGADPFHGQALNNPGEMLSQMGDHEQATQRLAASQAIHARVYEPGHRQREALYEAQLEGRLDSTHPFYWAGFVAAGDWR